MLSVQFKQGKVGPDGKELIPHESPTVNGYGFENMPSPAPGKWVSVTVWRQIDLCVSDEKRKSQNRVLLQIFSVTALNQTVFGFW